MLAADSPKVTALVEVAYTSAGSRSDRAEPAVSASMAEKFQSYLAAMARKRSLSGSIVSQAIEAPAGSSGLDIALGNAGVRDHVVHDLLSELHTAALMASQKAF